VCSDEFGLVRVSLDEFGVVSGGFGDCSVVHVFGCVRMCSELSGLVFGGACLDEFGWCGCFFLLCWWWCCWCCLGGGVVACGVDVLVFVVVGVAVVIVVGVVVMGSLGLI
jgi:hypothetical protein